MSSIGEIDPQTLQKWLTGNEVILIDVREPIENMAVSIQGAINIPLSQVDVTKFNVPEYKNKKIVFHCKSGQRSMNACEKLLSDNIENEIWNLKGGIIAWEESSLPVITGA